MRLKDLSLGVADRFKIDPTTIIVEDGFNQRHDFGDLDSLGNDILENGLAQDLIVRVSGTSKDKVYLVDGERRLRAILKKIKAGHDIPFVTCKSEGAFVKPVDRFFCQLSANTGKPFSLAEKGRVYLRILTENEDLTAAEIARRSQTTKQAVSNALKLVRKGSSDLLALVDAGSLAATTALHIIDQAETPETQATIATTALEQAKESGKDHITPKDLPKKDSENESPAPEDTPDPGKEEEEDPTTPSPPDPGAIERLKNAPETNRDGSTVGPGNNSSGFTKPDKQVLKIEKMLDELNPDSCLAERRTSFEIILRFINGETDLKRLKSHLKGIDQ